MKKTALTELIEFYKSAQNRMPYDVLCIRLAEKIMQLQTLERDQIVKAYEQRAIDHAERLLRTGDEYYDKTFV